MAEWTGLTRAVPGARPAGASGVQIGNPPDLSKPASRLLVPVVNKNGPLRGRFRFMAEWTGLEPATPGVTGRYSNQLNYHSRFLVGADGIEPPTLAL